MKFTDEMLAEDEKRWHARDVVTELGYCGNYMRDRKDMKNIDIRFYAYIMRKAHEMLKKQELRVMTLGEMNDKRGRGEAVYYEDRDATYKSQDVFIVVLDKDLDVVWLKAETYTLAAKMSTMGKTWRCWTSRPDEKERDETPWES